MMLREIVKAQIVEQILRPQSYDSALGRRKFSVLILDKVAMKVVNSCLALNEVFELGVTLVEDLTRNREPMPSMEAIYIIVPTMESVQLLVNDFTPRTRYGPRNAYKQANVYFLEPCEDDVFMKLVPLKKYCGALKEFTLSFIPMEKQIFAVSNPDVARTTNGIVSLCSSLNIYPVLSAEICYRVDQKLKDLQRNQPAISVDNDSQLIILDRSFDLISPLLHETTLQAMASDLCNFKNGIYQYTADNREQKVVPLDESDSMWIELRHKHIAEVLQRVAEITRETTRSARTLDDNASIRELGETIRQLPASQRKVGKLAAYLNLADECRVKFFESLQDIILLEQDMVTGHTPEGVKLKDAPTVGRLSKLILPAVPIEIRLRLILIYMLTVGKDKDEQFFDRLLNLTDIPEDEHKVIKKMLRWRNQAHSAHPHRERPLSTEERFPSSRWEPKVRDVLRDVVDNRLNEREFRYVGSRPQVSRDQNVPSSARFTSALSGGRPRDRKRKIIIFIVGGMTHSEMKVAYEMSEATNTTIYLGSDSVLTPNEFLGTLRGTDNE